MGKLLRVLAVIFLLLSGVALWLGIYLYGKREILKGRTQKLENTVITLGAFLESESSEAQPNTYPAKDTSDCTSELIETPTKSDFWNNYALHLEKQDNPTMNIKARQNELMSYYLIDGVTLKVTRDLQGMKVTDGKGTMQALLTEMTDKAKEQLNRLNQTRSQLTQIREELITTIEELNKRKSALRQALNEIVQLKENIRQLEEKIAGLEQKIRDLEAEKTALQDKITELGQKITKQEEDIKERDDEIVKLKADIKRLKDLKPTQGTGDGTPFYGKIGPGVKGEVISLNKEWNFVVIKISDEFIQEITNPQDGSYARGVHLMLRRANSKDAFVSKVSLTQLKRDEKLAIADILLDWQQLPVQEGDIVFF
jgi:hypothetical protein